MKIPTALFEKVQPPKYADSEAPPPDPAMQWVKTAAAIGDHAALLKDFFPEEAIATAAQRATERQEWLVIHPVLTMDAPPGAAPEEVVQAALDAAVGETGAMDAIPPADRLKDASITPAVRRRHFLGGVIGTFLAPLLARSAAQSSPKIHPAHLAFMQEEDERAQAAKEAAQRNQELIKEHFAAPPPELDSQERVVAAAALACQAVYGVPGARLDAADVLLTAFPDVMGAATGATPGIAPVQ